MPALIATAAKSEEATNISGQSHRIMWPVIQIAIATVRHILETLGFNMSLALETMRSVAGVIGGTPRQHSAGD